MEIQQTILAAAEVAFSHSGYSSVTLKDVAAEARVAESVLYRYFPSKAALFRQALLVPLLEVLDSFSSASARYVEYAIDARSILRLLVGSLMDQLAEHRAALRSIATAEDDLPHDEREHLHQALADVMVSLSSVARREQDRRGTAVYDAGVELSMRALVGMVISLVTHDAWLLRGLPGNPSRTEIVDHLVEMMLRAHPPPSNT